MRKVVFGGAASLDNFIARPDHAVDWLMWGEDAAAVMKDYWARFDAVVMGRRTYEIAAKSGYGGSSPGVSNHIASRTMISAPKGAEVARDGAALVRKLKAMPGKDICLMGGGDLAKSLFEEGLIDEIGFNIHPLLLGDGVALFHRMNRQIDLALKECRPFKNGCVYVVYDVKQRG